MDSKHVRGEREYDAVILGATGFTGQLVALESAMRLRRGDSPRFTLAGRNSGKLLMLQKRIEKECQVTVPICAISTEGDALKELLRKCSVCINCIGPFKTYGEQIVLACIDAGTHYVDITGEPDFVESIITKFDKAAQSAGVFVVPSCGFDSVPIDVAVQAAIEEVMANSSHADSEPISVQGYVDIKDAAGHSIFQMSNGTWTTLIESLQKYHEGTGSKQPRIESKLKGKRPGGDRLRAKAAHHSSDLSSWVIPYSGCDIAVVRRSSVLRQEVAEASGCGAPSVNYSQYLVTGTLGNQVKTMLFMLYLGAMTRYQVTRRHLLSKKSDGQGPSDEDRVRSFVNITVIARVSSGRGTRVLLRLPEIYETTAIAAYECARLLFGHESELLSGRGGGVMTPATAFVPGVLLRRLGSDPRVAVQVRNVVSSSKL